MPTPSIQISANVIATQGGKILLGIRHNAAGEGDWAFPGGHLEFGESLMECAKRELLEETGLVADNMRYLGVINQPAKEKHYIHFIFGVEDIVGEPKVLEPQSCLGWDWFDPTNLPSNFFFAHKKYLDTLNSEKELIEENLITSK